MPDLIDRYIAGEEEEVLDLIDAYIAGEEPVAPIGGPQTRPDFATTMPGQVPAPQPTRGFGQAVKEQFGTWRGLVGKVPFAGATVEAKDLYDTYEAAKRAEEGKATPEDWELLQEYQQKAQTQSTFFAGVVDIVSESVPFMLEFLASGGAIAAGKKALKIGAKQAVDRTLSSTIKRAATGVTRLGVESALRLPFFSHRVAGTTIGRMIPGYDFGEDEYEFIVLEQGEPFKKALKNAMLDTYIEIFSEQTGQALGFIGKRLRKGVKLRPPRLRVGAREFLGKMGYHGVLAEVGEERVGEILREAATRLGAADLPQQVPTLKQVGQEAVAFAVPGVVAHVAQTIPETRKRLIAKKTHPSRKDVPELEKAKDRDELSRLLTEQELQENAEMERRFREELEARRRFMSGEEQQADPFAAKRQRDSQRPLRELLRSKASREDHLPPELLDRSVESLTPAELKKLLAYAESMYVTSSPGISRDGEYIAELIADHQDKEIPHAVQEGPKAVTQAEAKQEAEAQLGERGVAEEEVTRAPVGAMMDQWLGEKAVQLQQIEVDTANFQEQVKATVGERHYGPKSKEVGQAIQVYIDLKDKPDQIAKWGDELTDAQKKIVARSQSLSPAETVIAEQLIAKSEAEGLKAVDEAVIGSIVDNYTMRLWEPSDTGAREGIPPTFGTKTKRAKPRSLESILHGWALGKTLRIKDATEAYRVARSQVAAVIENRKLLKTAEAMKVLGTQQQPGWLPLKHPAMSKWEYSGSIPFDPDARPSVGEWVRPTDRGNLGKIVSVKDGMAEVYFRNKAEGTEATVAFSLDELEGLVVRPKGKNFFITEDGTIMERRPLYAEPALAKSLNRILGTSALREVKGLDFVTKWNAIAKHTILTTSLFHHQAFLRSYMFAGRGLNPVKGYRKGREAIMNFDPELQDLSRAGLTLGRIQDFEEAALHEKTKIGQIIDKVPMAGPAKDWILEMRDRQTDFLFKNLGANLKAQTALLDYRHLMKKHAKELRAGTMTTTDVARVVADAVNADFGGLNLERTRKLLDPEARGRHPMLQHIFRLMALAPDWTESNVRMMAGAFQRGLKGEIYRAMWARVALRGLGATILFNFVMSAYDDDEFVERYKKAWKEGRMRWLEIDITPIYRALGGDDPKRKFFSLIGHFRDPLKFLVHPLRSAKHKSSVLSSTIGDAMTGTDWAGREFTTFSELLGTDDKGFYKTNRRGYYRRGELRGGKLMGELVRKTRGGGGTLDYLQLPSYLAYEAKSVMPIPIQNGVSFLSGEMDGFDAITKSLGLMVSTTYPEPVPPSTRRR